MSGTPYFTFDTETGRYHGLVAGIVVVAVVLAVLIILAFFYPKTSLNDAWLKGNGGTVNQALVAGSGSTFNTAAPTVVLLSATTVCSSHASYDSTTGIVTVNRTGSYRFDLNAIVSGVVTGGQVFSYLQVGTTAAPYPGLAAPPIAADGLVYVNMGGEVYLKSGQTFQIIIAHTAGSPSAVIDNVANPANFHLHLFL